MDNNKQPLPQSPTPQPVQAAPEPSPSVVTSGSGSQIPTPSTPSGGINKAFLAIGVILLILIAGGVYLYMNNQKPVPKVETTTKTETTVAKEVDTTDADLNAIDIQSEDTELSTVDADLQSL